MVFREIEPIGDRDRDDIDTETDRDTQRDL